MKNILPLKGLFLDDTYYSSEKLEIYWLPGDKILIKSDGRPIFGPFDVSVYAHTLVVSCFFLTFANAFTNLTSTSVMVLIPLIPPLTITRCSS
jgi:hypothetical protein